MLMSALSMSPTEARAGFPFTRTKYESARPQGIIGPKNIKPRK